MENTVSLTCLVLMVRGLFSNRKAPFAYFPCERVHKPNVIPVCGTVLSRSNAGIFKLGVLPQMEPAATGSSMKDVQRSAVLKTGHGTLLSMRERFIMDEMKVKSGLVFSSSGMLIGFCDVGDLKEELHNRFNLISEERVKIFKHNSENLMKIGWKIRKLWHFEVFANFQETFLDQSIWICKWVRWWCHRLTIFH